MFLDADVIPWRTQFWAHPCALMRKLHPAMPKVLTPEADDLCDSLPPTVAALLFEDCPIIQDPKRTWFTKAQHLHNKEAIAAAIRFSLRGKTDGFLTLTFSSGKERYSAARPALPLLHLQGLSVRCELPPWHDERWRQVGCLQLEAAAATMTALSPGKEGQPPIRNLTVTMKGKAGHSTTKRDACPKALWMVSYKVLKTLPAMLQAAGPTLQSFSLGQASTPTFIIDTKQDQSSRTAAADFFAAPGAITALQSLHLVLLPHAGASSLAMQGALAKCSQLRNLQLISPQRGMDQFINNAQHDAALECLQVRVDCESGLL